MKMFIPLILFIAMFVTYVPVYGATVTYGISGEFSNTVTHSSTDPSPTPYPFPELIGGGFDGSFSFDIEDPLDPNGRVRLRTFLSISQPTRGMFYRPSQIIL